jgi:hypothetical protein
MPRPVSRFDALDPAQRFAGEEDDAKSVSEALRAVLLFLTIVGFLAWAGVVEGASAGGHHRAAPDPSETRKAG